MKTAFRILSLILICSGCGTIPGGKEVNPRENTGEDDLMPTFKNQTAFFPNDGNIRNFIQSCSAKPEAWSGDMEKMLALAFRTGAIQVKVFPRKFSDQELSELKMPILFLLGEKEFIYDPQKAMMRAERTLPHLKGAFLREASHAIPMDQRERAAQEIKSWLRACWT